ncbi:MAG: lipoyl synthase [Candidatus Marinimicrobia bacterium]|nr:lipoyl synthase [Candidatus Neomarinimicrobiota bacterium]
MQIRKREKPDWLKINSEINEEYITVRKILKARHLHTVCEEAKCPNRGECWRKRTATIMILGEKCTRNCRFCAVGTNPSGAVDYDEPQKVAEAVELLGLKYCVLTSVTRDDLDDGGAELWAQTIEAIKQRTPHVKVEVLIPDFQGNESALKKVLDAKPDVLAHNLETVKELYPIARPAANYRQSLEVLRRSKDYGAITKTGIMVGLGEQAEQVRELLMDAVKAGCDILSVGQYLQPTKKHLEVAEYVTPEQFEKYRDMAMDIGFRAVMSAPLVRSSYHAEELMEKVNG